MTAFLVADGHIAWPLFIGIIFSGTLLLMGDIAWRVVKINFKLLIGITFSAWLVGVYLIFMFN